MNEENLKDSLEIGRETGEMDTQMIREPEIPEESVEIQPEDLPEGLSCEMQEDAFPEDDDQTEEEAEYIDGETQAAFAEVDPEEGQPEPAAKETKAKRKKKKKNRGRTIGWIAALIVAFMLGLIIGTYVVAPAAAKKKETKNAPIPKKIEESTRTAPSEEVEPDPDVSIGGKRTEITNPINPVPEIAEALKDSVVSVAARYCDEDGVVLDGSTGTGCILSETGYILTNYHIVSDKNTFVVTVSDGTMYDAKFVGGDSTADIAVLKINADKLKPIVVGDSDALKVGELVVAVGNPAGGGTSLVGTVTVGYVSSACRELLFNGSKQSFIQTDAAINPGNSGGPLVNSQGEVIGLVTLKTLVSSIAADGTSVDAEGIGFAIPINHAVETAKIIIAGGNIIRPGIGIWYQSYTKEEMDEENLPFGLVVEGFMENSPAEEAGMKVGDIILKCDGKSVTEENGLDIISHKGIGEKVVLTVWRNGKEMDLTVSIADINSMK